MRIYLDTANIKEIEHMVDLGLCDGVTTNPSLIAKEGRKYKEVLEEICDIVPLGATVSAEIVSIAFDDMIKEAEELKKIDHKIIIKVPINEVGIKVIHKLECDDIKTNATLCFSSLQAILVANAGGSYVSPFVGRLDDVGEIGVNLIANIRMSYNNYSNSPKIIVASIRNPIHVFDACRMGADIVTIPYKVLRQMFNHPLTDKGIEKFLSDYNLIPKEKYE